MGFVHNDNRWQQYLPQCSVSFSHRCFLVGVLGVGWELPRENEYSTTWRDTGQMRDINVFPEQIYNPHCLIYFHLSPFSEPNDIIERMVLFTKYLSFLHNLAMWGEMQWFYSSSLHFNAHNAPYILIFKIYIHQCVRTNFAPSPDPPPSPAISLNTSRHGFTNYTLWPYLLVIDKSFMLTVRRP